MSGGLSEDVRVTGVAAGGDGVGRLADGRAVFVRGALPGERVRVTVTEERDRFARAELAEVLEAAPERTAPPCRQVGAGCGGCDWQHVVPAAQRAFKARIVTDALRRIGKLEPPEPDLGPELPATGWRTTVRAVVDGNGRAGFRLHHAHDALAVGPEGCLVAHPLVDEILRDGRFPPPVREVTIRAGTATGERLVVCSPAVSAPGPGRLGDDALTDTEVDDPTDGGLRVPDGVTVPEGVTVVGADELAAGHRAWIHEVVAGRRWRISAESFFQGR
ncbi:MAG TPA: TRAM domain-containing protein, partial [Acidimicrobiia bacterium]|nr:TRAM domain-containing protein [Acidimicrobiia bacterium]